MGGSQGKRSFPCPFPLSTSFAIGLPLEPHPFFCCQVRGEDRVVWTTVIGSHAGFRMCIQPISCLWKNAVSLRFNSSYFLLLALFFLKHEIIWVFLLRKKYDRTVEDTSLLEINQSHGHDPLQLMLGLCAEEAAGGA